jgi:hypothetical protein
MSIIFNYERVFPGRNISIFKAFSDPEVGLEGQRKLNATSVLVLAPGVWDRP